MILVNHAAALREFAVQRFDVFDLPLLDEALRAKSSRPLSTARCAVGHSVTARAIPGLFDAPFAALRRRTTPSVR